MSFDHLSPPKALPVSQLREVAELLDIPKGAVPDLGATEVLVQELLTKSQALLTRAQDAERAVIDDVELWGDHLFDLADERAARLSTLRQFLQDLRVRNSVGKMNSLSIEAATMSAARAGKAELEFIEGRLAVCDRLSPVAEYLREACGVFGAGVDEAATLDLRTDILKLVQGDDAIDPAAVVTLRNAGEDLRRRFADLASRSYRHDHLDASGDARKRQLLEGRTLADLSALEAVSILAPGPLAQLRSDLVEIKVLVDIDEKALASSVILPGQSTQPRPIDGASASARLEDCERRTDALHKNWVATLRDSLVEPEMQEQTGFLTGDARAQVGAFITGGALPDPVTKVFVDALNQVFQRVDVRQLSIAELHGVLFPDTSPATADQLRERLDALLQREIGTTAPEQIRFLPATEKSS